MKTQPDAAMLHAETDDLNALVARHVFGTEHPDTLYPSSIADAWLVVEQFHEDGVAFALERDVNGVYSAHVAQWVERDASAPVAICRAAVKAYTEAHMFRHRARRLPPLVDTRNR